MNAAMNSSTTEGRGNCGGGESASAVSSAGAAEAQERAFQSIELTVYARIDSRVGGILCDRNLSNTCNNSGTSLLITLTSLSLAYIAHANRAYSVYSTCGIGEIADYDW